MTDERHEGVRAITVSPELWKIDPEKVAGMISEKMQDRPAEVWIIVIGPSGSAERIMDAGWIFGPAEPEL